MNGYCVAPMQVQGTRCTATTDYGLQITGYRVQGTGNGLQITDYRVQGKEYRAQSTEYWVLGTVYWVLGIGYWVPKHPDSGPTSRWPGCFWPGPNPNILA